MTDSKSKHISLQLNSELVSVEVAEKTAERFALDAGFGDETASQIGMVTREAVANAIIHGNKYDTNKYVRADFGITDEELSIQIADQGFGFDTAKVPDPLASENILRTSGRGVFLMRAILLKRRRWTLANKLFGLRLGNELVSQRFTLQLRN